MPRLRARPAPAAPLTAPSVAPTASSTRPRRGTASIQAAANAVIQRSSPEETRQSIHLTVKSSPNKLRQATGGAVPKAGVSRQNIVAGKRASRNSRIVREVDSEDDDDNDDNDDDDDEEEDDAEEVDAMELDDDEEEDDDMDAEGEEDEDMDADGDQDDDDNSVQVTPAPRAIVPAKQAIPVKPVINVTKAQDSVEAKEMAFGDDDDDELSDPDSDLEDDDAEGEDDIDAEGDDDDDIIPVNDDDEDMDSDIDLSRDQTPDVTKMTKRQRALVEEADDGALMALSNEAQKKKHLTAEEHAMRRAEMARRRKNLSEKRNQEEKIETINRLLKRSDNPKRGRKSAVHDIGESAQEDEAETERANPLYVRYVQNAKGTQMGVPDEWLQSSVGGIFQGTPAQKTTQPFSGRMVEEVA